MLESRMNVSLGLLFRVLSFTKPFSQTSPPSSVKGPLLVSP